MTLDEMCRQVAVYTDRADDFVKTTINGEQVYDPDDDPGIWYAAMKGSINNAYREVARTILMPETFKVVTLGEGAEVDLLGLDPAVLKMKAVYNRDRSAALDYDFVNRFRLKIKNCMPGDAVALAYAYAPEPLEQLTDEPIFAEGLVDPMVYISLACADIWLMERKLQPEQEWRQRYYSALAGVKKSLKSSAKSRIKKPLFR